MSSSPSTPSAPSPDVFSTLAVLVATVALSYKGIVAKLAYATGMNVDTLMLLRFAVAAPLLWLCARVMVRGESLHLTAKQWGQCAITGFSFFLASYFDLTAISMIDATLSRLILFTYPVFVILLNSLLSHRPPSIREVITCVVTYGGVCLAVLPKTSVSAQAPSTVGMLWALGSAVTYATYLTVSQKAMKEIGSVRFTAASNTITLAFMAGLVEARSGFGALTLPGEGVFWAAVGGVACTVIPFLLLFEGIRRCGAVRASMLGLTGPLITAVSAWAILGETLSPQQSLGFAVTLAGVASLSLPKDIFRRLRHA